MKCILAGGLSDSQGFVFYDNCGTPFIVSAQDVPDCAYIRNVIQKYKLGSWSSNYVYTRQRYLVIKGVYDIKYLGTELVITYDDASKICFSPTFSYTMMSIDKPFEGILPCSVIDKDSLPDILIEIPDEIATQAKSFALYALSSKIDVSSAPELFHQERIMTPCNSEIAVIPWGITTVGGHLMEQRESIRKLIIPSTVNQVYVTRMPNLEAIDIIGGVNSYPLSLDINYSTKAIVVNSINRIVSTGGYRGETIQRLGGTVLV